MNGHDWHKYSSAANTVKCKRCCLLQRAPGDSLPCVGVPPPAQLVRMPASLEDPDDVGVQLRDVGAWMRERDVVMYASARKRGFRVTLTNMRGAVWAATHATLDGAVAAVVALYERERDAS